VTPRSGEACFRRSLAKLANSSTGTFVDCCG
jgi:hypothetical protein